jgi:TonB family protein
MLTRRAFLPFMLLLACGQQLLALSSQQLAAIGAQAAKSLEYGPKPDYPFEARVNHFAGSGIFIIRVHVKTGRVAEVLVARSTGYAILDNAGVRAFRRSRFKPGALQPIGVIAPSLHDPFGKEDALLHIPLTFQLAFRETAFRETVIDVPKARSRQR